LLLLSLIFCFDYILIISGDLGDIAMRSRSTQRTMFQPQPLSVRDVYKKLRAIASEHGSAVCFTF
jgi:ATP-dependent DNA ligase